MSELKRVAPQTLELSGSLGNGTKKEKKGEKGKKIVPSFRFELTLADKNEKGYSEFNFTHLFKAAEKEKSKENKCVDENAANGLDPFDDDDEDKLREMAKRFEAKYGNTTVGKSRKKFEDDVDRGAGYDENDSFIDNTDAYDEVVPEGVTTALGGFYINSGALEFDVKAAERSSLAHRNNNNNNNDDDDDDSSESSEDEAENSDSPVSKRDHRIISSSDEENTEENPHEPPSKKSKIDENGEKKSNHDNVIKKRKKMNRDKDTDGENRTKNSEEKQDLIEIDILSEPDEGKKIKADAQRIKVKKFDIKSFVKKPNTANGVEEKKLEPKKVIGKDRNIDDAIESVVNDGRIDDESSRDTMSSGKSRCIAGTSSECEDTEKGDHPLPDNLPENIKDIINKIKKQAENNKEGKIKFFDSSVNEMLLNMEKKLRQLDSSSMRSQVHGHLAHFLSCSKITLANRAKKLFLQDAEDQAKGPIDKLKVIIDRVMPTAIERYNKECQRLAGEKGLDQSPSDDSSEVEEKVQEKPKIPRRRFPWSSESRKLVCEIATVRRQYFKMRKPRKESMEAFVSSYLELKVLPLWPTGWMNLQGLLKYSNPEPVAKRKQKKQQDQSVSNNIQSSIVTNCSLKLDANNANNLSSSAQERVKTPTITTKVPSDNPINFSMAPQQSGKSSEIIIERKHSSNKHKDKIRESSTMSSQHESAPTIAPLAKISVVPTAQLMAPKTSKNNSDKFNPMDLTSSSLSITPVSDYQKSSKTSNEVKKDVVSITPYSESSSLVNVINESSHSINKPDVIPYSIPNQSSKPISLKQRILQDNADGKIERNRNDERDVEVLKTEHKDKKRDRWPDDKHRSHDLKKRRKEYKSIEQSHLLTNTKSDVSSIIQPPSQLSKEEQEQRQIEETMAATNFLSQIINDDTPRSTIGKRKESILVDDNIANIIQPSEQEKDVQMVMQSLKELQEMQEMKYSPSHSPHQKPKPSHQYVGYPDDYHRLYNNKKDDKLRLSKDDQW